MIIIDLYHNSPDSVKYLKHVVTSVLTHFLRKAILFLSTSLALSQFFLPIILLQISLKISNVKSIMVIMCAVYLGILKKAFHIVDHQILSQKLYHYGILGLAHIGHLNRIYPTNNNFFLQVFLFGNGVSQMSSISRIYIRYFLVFALHQWFEFSI